MDWSRCDYVPDCEPGQVHVWRVALDPEPQIVASLRGVLSGEETERADRFHFDRDRAAFTVVRATLRELLSGYLSQPASSFVFQQAEHDKPFLADTSLRFNVSHSAEWGLLAFTREREIGVDIEKMRDDIEQENLARRFFSEREVQSIERLQPHQRHAAFFACWTRKEAYIKAEGRGMSIPLDAFDVSVDPAEPARLLGHRESADETERWSFLDLDPAPGYAAALAVEGALNAIETFHRSPLIRD